MELDRAAKALDTRLRKANALGDPAQLALSVRGMQRAYLLNPPPATFRLLVSPLVMWIWTGGLIIIGGALVALWPAPDSARRKVRAEAAARVARDLGRV